MGRRWLGAGEREVVTLRPHAKVMARPLAILLALAVIFGAGWRIIDPERPELRALLIAVEILAVVWLVLPALLRWRTTRYVITTQRVLTRRGLFGRVRRDLGLPYIRTVTYRRSLADRALGCGTLQLITDHRYPVELSHMPDVDLVRLTIDELRQEQAFLAGEPRYAGRS